MNELLGWYGYDGVDSQDTEHLNLQRFTRSTDAKGENSENNSDNDSDNSSPRPSASVGSSKGEKFTHNILSPLTTAWVRIPFRACEKVACDLGLGSGFSTILWFMPPLITD